MKTSITHKLKQLVLFVLIAAMVTPSVVFAGTPVSSFEQAIPMDMHHILSTNDL